MEQDIAVGLDIGTTKVCAIVASTDPTYPGKLKILGIGKSPSEGLTRGVVTNKKRPSVPFNRRCRMQNSNLA
jgi:cell division protein FtsA